MPPSASTQYFGQAQVVTQPVSYGGKIVFECDRCKDHTTISMQMLDAFGVYHGLCQKCTKALKKFLNNK